MVWATDTIVSMPGGAPEGRPVEVDFGGFGFTTGGICQQMTEVDRQDMINELYAPVDIP